MTIEQLDDQTTRRLGRTFFRSIAYKEITLPRYTMLTKKSAYCRHARSQFNGLGLQLYSFINYYKL